MIYCSQQTELLATINVINLSTGRVATGTARASAASKALPETPEALVALHPNFSSELYSKADSTNLATVEAAPEDSTLAPGATFQAPTESTNFSTPKAPTESALATESTN